MSNPARVLLIGNQLEHLEMRAHVLQNFWTIALAELERSEIPVHQTDLVVLCHTLPHGERDAWITRIRLALPKLLVVKMNGYDSGPHGGADATVDVRHGPGALVSTIYELLTERGLPSRAWPESPMQQRLVEIH